MDNQSDYYLLLADLTASTNLLPSQSSEVLQALDKTLKQMNTDLREQLVAPLEINYGDEFAGLFSTPDPIYDLVDAVRHSLRNLATFRFVVAHGRIGYASGPIRQMGGPVFKEASIALIDLKRTGRFADWRFADALSNATLNMLTNTSHVLIEEMTDYQYHVYRSLRRGGSQTDIAATLGKYEQSISKAVQRSHAALVIDTEAILAERLLEHAKVRAGIARSL